MVPTEIYCAPELWERTFCNGVEKGGHFAAWEQRLGTARAALRTPGDAPNIALEVSRAGGWSDGHRPAVNRASQRIQPSAREHHPARRYTMENTNSHIETNDTTSVSRRRMLAAGALSVAETSCSSRP